MPTPRAQADCEHLLLTRSQSAQLGFSAARVDTLLRSGRWQAPVRGVLATVPGPLDLPTRCRAALLSQQRPAVISHQAATVLHGLPSLHRRVDRIDVTLPPPATTHQPTGLRLHWPKLDEIDMTDIEAIPCTTVPRSIVDVARSSAWRRWSVVLADAAVFMGKTTPDELAAAADRLGDPRARRQVGRLLALVDGRSRSPKETQVRLILVDAQLPVPQINWPLYDQCGRLLAIGDLVYDKHLLWMEYDGYDVHSPRAAFRADRIRERVIRDRGFEVLRLVDQDVDHPRGLVEMVHRKLAEAPLRIASLPPGLSPEVDRAQALLAIKLR